MPERPTIPERPNGPDRPGGPERPNPPATTPPRDDAALVKAVQRNDAGAWSALLSRHQDRLYAVCLRMVGNPETAADLCQDTMVKIIQGLSGFDGSAQLSTWMVRVAMNVCLSHLRAAKIRRTTSLDAPPPAIAGRIGPSGQAARSRGTDRSEGAWVDSMKSGEPGVEHRVQEREDHQLLVQALGALEPEPRAILVLRDVRGLDYDQIAAALGIAVGTVKSRLFRARAALRELMERQGPQARE